MTVLFSGWDGIGRALLTAVILYLGVILFVRLFGKRSTSQMNNFDWVVTVAMGSMVASSIVSKDVVVAEALTGVFALLLLQYLVTWLVRRVQPVSRAVRATPAILFFRGRFVEESMARERVSRDELMAAMRQNGIQNPGDVYAIVLENNAQLSVIRSPSGDVESPVTTVAAIDQSLPQS